MQPNKLFVANISFEVTEEEVRELFEGIGTVDDLYYARDHETGRPRGFAFVTFSTAEEAEEAIEKLNGHVLNDRDLRISVARPKEERPRGGPSRGGFSDGPRAPRLGGGGGGRGGFGGGRGGDRGGDRGGYGGGDRGGYGGGRGGDRGGRGGYGGRGGDRGGRGGYGGRGGDRGGYGDE